MASKPILFNTEMVRAILDGKSSMLTNGSRMITRICISQEKKQKRHWRKGGGKSDGNGYFGNFDNRIHNDWVRSFSEHYH